MRNYNTVISIFPQKLFCPLHKLDPITASVATRFPGAGRSETLVTRLHL